MRNQQNRNSRLIIQEGISAIEGGTALIEDPDSGDRNSARRTASKALRFLRCGCRSVQVIFLNWVPNVDEKFMLPVRDQVRKAVALLQLPDEKVVVDLWGSSILHIYYSEKIAEGDSTGSIEVADNLKNI